MKQTINVREVMGKLKKFLKRYGRIITMIMVVVLVLVPVGGNSILAAAVNDMQEQTELVEEQKETPTEEVKEEPDEELKEEPDDESKEGLVEEPKGESVDGSKVEWAEEVEEEQAEEPAEEEQFKNSTPVFASNAPSILSTESTGDVVVKLPEGTSSTYDITWGISQYKADGQPVSLTYQNTFNIEVQDDKGTPSLQSVTFTNIWNDAGGYGEWIGTVTGVASGSEVSILDMEIFGGTGDGAYVQTNCNVLVKSSDVLEKVEFVDQDNPLVMTNGGVHTLIASSKIGELPQITTEDTFLGLGGKYTLEYLLNAYNVISFNDIEANHIIGAVISKNDTSRSTQNPNTDIMDATHLSIADYTRGYLSYIGSLRSWPDKPNETNVKLAYGYDLTMSSKHGWEFVSPNLYIGETDSNGDKMGLENEGGIDKVSLMDGSKFPSPNNAGTSPTYQNDSFIDFDEFQQAMIDESDKLYEDGSIEGKTNIIIIEAEDIPESGILDVDAGTSVRIMDASRLECVNLVFEEGYDYFHDQFSEPTTINFAGTTINPIKIKEKSHSQFPDTTINGKLLSHTEGDTTVGENVEFGEYGSKIIWNLPNVVTTESGENRLVTKSHGPNLVGHIVAPRAEYWNYDTAGNNWEGGNINGCIIVANFRGGTTETHMFPYTGKLEEEKPEEKVSVNLDATKTFTNGDLTTNSFEFILDYVGEAIGDYDENWLSEIVESDADGNINFTELEFKEAGTYVFHVSEKLPDGYEDLDIEFDKTVYEVTIVVTDGAADDDMAVTKTIKPIKGRDGVDVTASEVDKMAFENKVKEEPTTASMEVTLTKADDANKTIVLEGAEFKVEQITSADDHTVVAEGYSKNYTSGADGTLTITELQESCFYKVTEIAAPAGYLVTTDYWVIAINEGATAYTITAYTKDGVKLDKDMTDNIITNVMKEVFILPETGGIGSWWTYLIGIVLMSYSFICYRRKGTRSTKHHVK